MKLISIVVPVFNEEGSIPPLMARLQAVFAGLPYDFELIFVEDGSTDGTVEAMERAHLQDPRVHYLLMSRNFGHQLCLLAGIHWAAGDAVVMMDGDLQHPPELLPEMIRHWEQGDLLVETLRLTTEGRPARDSLGSRLFYWLVNKVSETPITPNAADFRLLDRRVVEVVKALPERHVFLRGLVTWVGFPRGRVSYRAESRQYGKTKYSLRRMVSFAADGLVSFSVAPLRLALVLGFLVSLLGMLYGAYILVVWLYLPQWEITGWPSLILSVLLLGGLQLIILGIMGEYLGRIYDQVKGRPQFIVHRARGWES